MCTIQQKNLAQNKLAQHSEYSVSPAACSDLFISEQLDGKGLNNAIEIFNPTHLSINLSSYSILIFPLGSFIPLTIPLNGIIAAKSTFVLANPLANGAILARANQTDVKMILNGLNAVVLKKNNTYIDKIGEVGIIPPLTGWLIPPGGSTMMHDIRRKFIVTAGNMVWNIAKNEWTIFPPDSTSNLNYHKNICTGAADISFTFENQPTTCGNPSYVNFDIMAASNPSTVFNNTTVDIKYSGGELSGDNFTNGDIIVTQGSNFQPGFGNDYNILNVTNLSDSVLEINFGDVADSSPNATTLTATPQALLQVSLKIQNSCQTDSINFTNDISFGSSSYYTITDSTYSHTDSTQTGTYSTCCPYVCGSYCCDGTDSLGNCIGYCDTYCYDTTWNYTYNNVYTYFNNNVSYSTVIFSANGITSTACPLTISNYTNPINAGTNAKSVPANSSILTINGTGFGSKIGHISVADANSGGVKRINLDSVDIKHWTENQIVIKMPSYMLPPQTLLSPGSGPIEIINSCMDSSFQYPNLTINYNISNRGTISFEKLRPNIVMNNVTASDTASLIFRCDTSVSHNPQAYACVKKAIREWNCYTGVNWKLGVDTTLARDTLDGISNIYFSNVLSSSGALMETSTHEQCTDVADSLYFSDESDINMRQNLNYGYIWSYDTTCCAVSPGYYYFYDAILHELGHAHLLGHVNDSLSLMYWQLSTSRRENITTGDFPGPQTLYGAFDVINTSTGFITSCASGTLIRSTSDCKDPTLSVLVVSANPYNLTIFPNPAISGEITVAYQLNTNAHIQFELIDCLGRVIISFDNKNKLTGTYSEQLNIDALAAGIYLFTSTINGKSQTIKFIKL